MLPDLKFHHIGVAVNEIDRTSSLYVDMGYSKSDTTFDPIQNVNICFLKKAGEPTVELLSPVDDSSPVTQTLKKSGVTPYHVCYSVDNITDAIAMLRSKKFIPVSRPVDAVALGGSRVCFLYNRDMGLIELVENP